MDAQQEDERHQGGEREGKRRPSAGSLQCVFEADARCVLPGLHRRYLASDLIHVGPTAVGLDDRKSRVEPALGAQLDGLLELGELGRCRLGDRVQVLALDDVVGDKRTEAGDRAGDDRVGFRVGLKVSLVAGEQVAALAGLGVPEVREHVL